LIDAKEGAPSDFEIEYRNQGISGDRLLPRDRRKWRDLYSLIGFLWRRCKIENHYGAFILTLEPGVYNNGILNFTVQRRVN
jgi:hypothetical protein